MRVYGGNCPEITEVDLNMGIRAVKDKRPSKSVRIEGAVLGLSCELHLKDKGRGQGSS